jgi:hypothetical protein
MHRWEGNLKQILKKWDVNVWTGFNWLRIQSSVGSCEKSNKPSDSIKGGEFRD